MAAAMRTAGSGPVGQSGGASLRRTSAGTSNAAGPSTSKGNAPNTIGAIPGSQRRLCGSHVAVVRSHAVGNQGSVGPAQGERWFGESHGMVNPSALSCRSPCSNPQTAIEAGEHAESAALDKRQLEPARDHRAGKVAMADEHHVARLHLLERHGDSRIGAITDLRNAFTAGTAVCPHQPIGFGLVDLRGGQTLVGAVIPLGQ